MGSVVLLDLMGGVALLLWGLHMVLAASCARSGPTCAAIFGKALGNRFTAFAAGLGLTALLQSSTATGLMTASLAADGVVEPRSRACDHARRQCRHDADRPGAVVQYLGGRAGSVHDRPGHVPRRRHQRSRGRSAASPSASA